MRVSYRTLMAALFVLCGLAVISAGNIARAQTQVSVINNSTCPIEVVLTDGMNRNIFFINPTPVPPPIPLPTVTLSPGFTPTGVISAAGTTFPFVNGCTLCISLHDHATPTSTCCVVVCLNLSTSPGTMTISPCAAPCNP